MAQELTSQQVKEECLRLIKLERQWSEDALARYPNLDSHTITSISAVAATANWLEARVQAIKIP